MLKQPETSGAGLRGSFPRKPKANPKSVVSGDKYRFTVLTDGLLRYEYAEDGKFEDRASTFAINRDLPTPEFELITRDGVVEIITSRYHMKYDKKPLSASGFTVQIKGNITDWKSLWRYGGGIKEEDHNLYGTARTLDEADGRIQLERGVLSTSGYASIDDSESFLFNDDGWVVGRQGTNKIDGYLFAYGLDFKAAMKAFYAVSGGQPLLPRWALGNWWSRYYKYTAKEYLKLMDRFRSDKIPFSVGVVDMDWHLVDNKIVKQSSFSGWTGYTWERELFPDPPAFVKALHDRKLKTCLNDHPADGCAPYEEKFKEMSLALGRDPAKKLPIAFDIANKQYADAHYDILLRNIENDGIDFWWVDWQQGPYSSLPGVDPLWMLNHLGFLNNKRGGKRPLMFSRFAGPGSHRYPVGFSGDTVVTWESLDFQPEFTATASNIGYGWWSHDIGGHMQGYRDDELVTRWVQLGVFSPVLRLHSTANPWNTKEPWRFTKEAREAQVDALRLRHQLLPYLYSMNVRSAQHDEPIVQPIYWHYPERSEAYVNKNTYMFGSELFVVPITSPRDKVTLRARTDCWLPPGRWVDVFSDTVYQGNRQLSFHRTLSQYAVLAKEGSIVPLDAADEPENGCPNPSSISLLVVVGADATFYVHEDDGTGATLGETKIITTPIHWSQEEGKLTIGPALGGKSSGSSTDAASVIPSKRSWKIEFVTTGQTISAEDCPTNEKTEFWFPGKNPTLRAGKPLAAAHAILDEAQSSLDGKNVIWDALAAEDVSNDVRLGNLLAIKDVPESLKSALMEVLLADPSALPGKK